MKRNKRLLILIGVLVLCIVGYAVVSAISKKQENVEQPDSSIAVTDFSADTVARLCWTYQGEEFTLTKTDGSWYNEADKDFPVKQSYVSTMSTQIASMTASRKLSDVTDLSEYGLDKPAVTVSLMTDTGGELSFAFGDINNVTNEYYMQYSEGSSLTANSDVYLIPASVVNAFCYKMDQLVQFEELPDLTNINSIKIEANETYRLSYMGEEEAIPWTLRDESGSKRGANTELCEQLADALKNLSFNACVSYDAVSTDLADFGLDDPWAVITVDYDLSSSSSSSEEDVESDTITISLGNVDENGDRYVMVDGMRMLYTIDADLADWIRENNIASITDLSDML